MKKRTIAVSVIVALGMAGAALAAGYYTTGMTGYDIAQKTGTPYPATPFGFGIVNVTAGRAYGHNANLAAEFAWAKQGTTGATLYVNLNTDVGSTAKGNTASPDACKKGDAVCKAYNYGYNAAADAFAYAASQGASSPLWWLDIETANSWSPNTAVNDATIQGAINFLNGKSIQVGVYSTQGTWNAIGGSTFVPTQTTASSTPTWVPIGLGTPTMVQAACNNQSFIQGSQTWLIQYETSGASVDQDYSC